jgi:hypothetical protein
MSHKTLSESKQRDKDRYLQLLNLSFSEHNFFYSFTSHITLTQQAGSDHQHSGRLDRSFHAGIRRGANRLCGERHEVHIAGCSSRVDPVIAKDAGSSR